jgi:hypothetical protein
MMRRSWMVAASFVMSASAVGVGAGTTANMKGSDTLFDFTNAMIAACPGTLGPYRGTGSTRGQTAMLAGVQQVAPMSQFLDSSACDGGVAAAPAQSQGLVIGLDGIALMGSRSTTAGSECNGDDNVNCVSTFEPLTGAAYDTTVTTSSGPYTFSGWRDVLRVLLAGFDHNAGSNWAKRNCNSPVRQAIASQYGAFFENTCSAAAGEATADAVFNPICQEIRHIFRPDDFSAATDALVSLLGLPSVVYPETTVALNTTSANPSADIAITQHTGASPFCNAVRPAFVYARPQPTTLQGSDATWDPTSTESAVNGRETAVYRAAYQDNDPIRRLCAGTGVDSAPAEDVCSHSGDLGLLLPISDVQEPAPRTTADRYNAKPCVASGMTSVQAPEVFDAITQKRITCGRVESDEAGVSYHGLLCPNGDACNFFGGCDAPADAAGNPQCLASAATTPSTTVNAFPVPHANLRLASDNDGRSYNQHLYAAMGMVGVYQVGNSATNSRVTGAYYRIHASHSLAPAGGAAAAATCQRADTSDQIACLVTASPCSIGYGSLRGLSANPGAGAIKIDKQSPEKLCIQGHFLYPLSRKLYLNSVPGFENVTGQELQLAGCMTDLAQPGLTPPTPGGLVTANLSAAGFIQIPPAVNNGEPFCEDFNEAALCGAPTNQDACSNRPPSLGSFPAFETVCGDGLIDPYEDCDNGKANGPFPAACSTSCRFNH